MTCSSETPLSTCSFFKMTREHDFVVDLAKAGKSAKEIKAISDLSFGDKSLSISAIYRIVAKVKAGENAEDQRHLNAKRTKRTDDLVEAVRNHIASDARVTVEELMAEFDLSKGTIFNILHDDLNLTKKSARWVPKLLSEDEKAARVRCAKEFLKRSRTLGAEFLNSIVTMDETMVPFFTPETKEMSKQWLPKGSPAPTKAKVQASRKKQMVMAFFDNEGPIYMHYVPIGVHITAKYFVNIMKTFLKVFKRKRPNMAENEWFFHMDNAPSHTAKLSKAFMAEKKLKIIEHPPYSPDLAPADFFLFPRVKRELSGVSITSSTVRTEWERALNTISKDDFGMAFSKWEDRWRTCIDKEGSYVEK